MEQRAPGAGAVKARARVVALGASNLTRGLPALVAAARHRWGPDVEVVAAAGLGRSYGMESTVLVRTLPGILDCGLWADLAGRPPLPTRALVTDVGNDIVYGAPPERILDWIAEAVARLRRHTSDVVIAGLPLDSLRRLSRAKFLAFRTLLYRRCRLDAAQVLDAAESVSAGLEALAGAQGARFVAPDREWYGFDPVHVRPARWRSAWQTLLCGGPLPDAPPASLAEALRVHAAMPRRQRLFGVERVSGGEGLRLRHGGRLWLY
jgi:hypothetical protein